MACNISTDAGKHMVFLAPEAKESAIVDRLALPGGLADVSYGRRVQGEGCAYFPVPTPGAENSATERNGFTKPVSFSERHGYKNAAFQLTLSCPEDPTAEIYYTTNGTRPVPNATGTTRYSAPITISKTTVVRAVAYDANTILQVDSSASYLFVSDILQQGTTPPEGFPASGAVNSQAMRYGMRSASTLGDPDAEARLWNGFTNGIRTVSIVMDPDDLFGKTNGIYVNASVDGLERPTNVEQIFPTDTADEFSVSCGIRIRGASSRLSTVVKHSFRLCFRSEYGMGTLYHPLFGSEGADEFEKIDFRSEQNSAWHRGSAGCTLIQDVFSRDSQRDMGEPYNRSRYYHLFLNGVYWGIYQTEERVTGKYASEYLGGNKDNYDVIRTSQPSFITSVVEGDTKAWENFWRLSIQEGFGTGHEDNYNRVRGLNPDGTRNPAYPIYLDTTNLVCYLLTSQFTVDGDSPVNYWGGGANNIIAYRNRVEGDGKDEGFHWNRHDAENSLGHDMGGQYDANETALLWGTRMHTDAHTTRDFFGVGNFNPALLNYELCENADYRRTFGDLVQKHLLTPGGAMTAAACEARYRSRMAELDDAIMGELARWGGSFTRSTWTGYCEADVDFINKRTPYLIAGYRALGWFPSIDAPTPQTPAGVVEPGAVVAFTSAGTDGIYLTTDGSDPMTASPAENGRVQVNRSCTVKARAKKGAEWSALMEVEYAVSSTDGDGYEFVFSGDYDTVQTVAPTGTTCKIVLTNANLRAGLEVPAGITAKLNASSNTVNRIGSIAADKSEVRFTGAGTVLLEGKDTLATVSNLVVKSGTLQVKSTGVAVTKTPVIKVLGFVEQTGGTIEMDLDVATTNQIYGIFLASKDLKDAAGDNLGVVYARFDGGAFNATVGGTKSSAIYVDKGSVKATFKGGQTLDVVLKGTEPRFISAAGDINFKNCQAQVSMPSAYSTIYGARVFKSDKKISLGDIDGHYVVDVRGPNAEIFSAGDAITIDGGTFELVASDDCFSALNRIKVNGGLFYAVSTEDDVFDSNGDMEINGGTILAYATAEGHEAFDVDPEATAAGVNAHQLRINGGTIFATGGKTADWPDNLSVASGLSVYAEEDLTASTYSGRYLTLPSALGVRSTAKLPVMPSTKCAVLATCPAMSGTPSVSATAPTEGNQDFHDLYIVATAVTNQEQLRFLEIYGSTQDGLSGDTGEYIVLTNISAQTIQLAGVKVNVEKYADWDKSGESASKCLFTLASGTIPAYGSVRLDQATYWGGAKQKITNGELHVALTDATGAAIQSGRVSFDNTKYPGVDGEGSSLVAISFETQLKDDTTCWRSSTSSSVDPGEDPGEEPGEDPGEDPGQDPDPVTGDYYVSLTGSDSNNGTSEATAFATIAHAVSVALAGKRVCVLAGTYEITSEISVDKAITIQGQGWANTVIKPAAGTNIRCITLDGGARLEGVTLTGGYLINSGADGAGAWVKNGTISRCCISNNTVTVANVAGAGVSFTGGQGSIDHSIVANNTLTGASWGGGIGAFGTAGEVLVDTCLVYGNVDKGGSGGGLGLKNIANAWTVRNSTITGNKCLYSGGGIFRESNTGKLVLVNTIVAGNLKTFSSEAEANLSADVLDKTNSKNCFFGLQKELNSITGSLYGDPAFVSAATGDYHLQESSTAIGAGSTYAGIGTDLDGKAFAATPAIGCYEYGTATEPGDEWDIPGTSGGINGMSDGKGGKCISFKSIALQNGNLTVDFEAGLVDGEGAQFELICKERLTDTATFTITVTLKNGATTSLGSLSGATNRSQLFILGIGAAK